MAAYSLISVNVGLTTLSSEPRCLHIALMNVVFTGPHFAVKGENAGCLVFPQKGCGSSRKIAKSSGNNFHGTNVGISFNRFKGYERTKHFVERDASVLECVLVVCGVVMVIILVNQVVVAGGENEL